ncbi:hypothetical protein MLD38_008172 [Melastoma candidum]|uniref:Uncharacterized protein n=1 Tax=Melastoma candidum TaxID=119954 RepID=A0ACB9RU08_9MYRT|nr:hypothetical protein MLD38_008172 [Melastoma candidum]
MGNVNGRGEAGLDDGRVGGVDDSVGLNGVIAPSESGATPVSYGAGGKTLRSWRQDPWGGFPRAASASRVDSSAGEEDVAVYDFSSRAVRCLWSLSDFWSDFFA